MDQKKLSGWLRLIIAGCAVCGVALFALLLPKWLLSMAQAHPGYHPWAWAGCMWAAAVPCYGVLICVARIAREIGADHSFSVGNARMLKIVAMLALGDAGFIFLATVLLCLIEKGTPAILPVIGAFVVFVGVAVSVAAACLSHLVLKAAKLQEDSDLTI